MNASRISGIGVATEALTTALITNTTAFQSQTSALIGAPGNPSPLQEGGGIWTRGIGGTFDTRTNGSIAVGSDRAGNPPQLNGCNTRTFSNYSGLQLGTDISRLNIDGANIHLGVTAGYSELSLRSPTNNGVLTADLQIPFVGFYGAVTKGGFYLDGQVRWDFFQGRLANANEGVFGQRLDAGSLSLIGNTGYQVQLGNGWFVEPSVGGVYSEAKLDPFTGTGNRYFQTYDRRQTPAAAAQTSNIESILGRASVRVGTTVALDGLVLQPFVTASVFHEFAGAVRTSIVTLNGGALGDPNPRGLDTTAQLTSGRVGTYGQFALGIAGQVAPGWIGYVRGDYRTGDHVEGWGLSGGLRYQFAPEAVAARALISKDQAPTPVAIAEPVRWTGFSVGVAVGGNWGQTRQSFPVAGNPVLNPPTVNPSQTPAFTVDPLSFSGARVAQPHVAGILAGGGIGADYQFGSIVVGLAGDVDWTNGRGGRSCPNAIYYTCESELDLLVLGTARVGYATGRSLFYVKGGGAFGEITERFRDNSGGQPLFSYRTVPSSTARSSSTGWTLGAGVEFALGRNWSAKAEYMHYELEAKRVALQPAGYVANAQHTGDLVKIGLNYRFSVASSAPVEPARAVIAKY
ncbi:hypothetical protein MPOCJGCO_2865 [Methylobacterium trifolii]|uniref:Autotransporter domain-containing protein n=1 Tax=Methylobacterium trifolii TaxID=1003092 RepID=A0ABQ4TZR7_9HYPH|nr:hypothetical protein MPOCJGCO_2865 [Methylobacterium trifolii]